jgi:hypothetical protein
MKSGEGIIGLSPVIKKVTFEHRGKITVHLGDGREVSAPLSLFPSIKKLTSSQRKKYTIADENVIIFHHCDEVYHIEQFLGRPADYEYNFAQ